MNQRKKRGEETGADRLMIELKLTGCMEKNELIREKLEGIKSNDQKNFGNTCYMNSVVQCLARCKRLKKAMNRGKTESGEENRVVKLIREALDIAAKMNIEKLAVQKTSGKK